MYQLADLDLVEIQVVGRLHGQETRNVYHYYVSAAAVIPDGRSALVTAGNDFLANLYEAVLAFQSNEWTCSAVTIQKIAPQRFRLIKLTPSDLIGDVESNSLPSSSAAVISRYAEQAGRAFQGRVFIPGVPTTFEEDSLINEDGMLLLEAAAAFFDDELAIDGSAVLRPTLAHTGNDPAPQQVVDAIATDVLRVQRRREVGRGS